MRVLSEVGAEIRLEGSLLSQRAHIGSLDEAEQPPMGQQWTLSYPLIVLHQINIDLSLLPCPL